MIKGRLIPENTLSLSSQFSLTHYFDECQSADQVSSAAACPNVPCLLYSIQGELKKKKQLPSGGVVSAVCGIHLHLKWID